MKKEEFKREAIKLGLKYDEREDCYILKSGKSNSMVAYISKHRKNDFTTYINHDIDWTIKKNDRMIDLCTKFAKALAKEM